MTMYRQNHVQVAEKTISSYQQTRPLGLYAIDLSPLIRWQQIMVDEAGLPCKSEGEEFDPKLLGCYGLVHWDLYCTHGSAQYREAFLKQATWFVENERFVKESIGGWMTSSLPHLSACIQGIGLSLLVRAYQLTHQPLYLGVINRVVNSFTHDILDGGIYAPVGEDGIFFQENACYPAKHSLSGFLFAFQGLYDFLLLGENDVVERLLWRSYQTLHVLLDEFDVGYWTRSDLLSGQLASPSLLALQARQLEAVARVSGCHHCFMLALRWKGYLRNGGSHLRALIAQGMRRSRHALALFIRSKVFPQRPTEGPLRVCVPVYGFPIMGGTRAVLLDMAEVMRRRWEIEYLAQRVEAHNKELLIHSFGSKRMAPWQFPAVWLYVFSGAGKLLSLIQHHRGYHMIMPQDGVFTAAFAAFAAKIAGIRVVCIDHGNVTLIDNKAYRDERIQAISVLNWTPFRIRLARLQYRFYWPSLKIYAWLAARMVDHFLIPGVPGDAIEASCKRLNIPMSRVTRFASMIDMDRHQLPAELTRAQLRRQKGIAPHAIVVALICRLAPEKGIDIALESISYALASCSPEMRQQVCIIIAGDGPLRGHVENEIVRRGLAAHCMLWGAISHQEVLLLLQCSDIFLYTSTRGACFSMAVLEAMASGCAVVASTEPLSNAHLLNEERGIAVSANDPLQLGKALITLINNPALCSTMGQRARQYIETRHSATAFARDLLRVSYWSMGYEASSHGTCDPTQGNEC